MKNRLIVALSLAMFLAAIEGTIVTLAIPTIVGDLKGFDLISHVFSVYLLTGALATPLYGKLSDLYGRKRMLLIGIVLFVSGSALCGLAQNMVMLIVFRALQGIGAGALFTVPMIIVGDVFPLHERGRIQGALSMVWGVAGLLGPFMGGLLIDLLSWHWIFFINVPFGLLALIILQKSFHEQLTKHSRRIDFPGIAMLALSMLAFLGIFILDSENGNLLTLQNAVLLLITIALLAIFVRIEKHSAEPIIPMGVLTRSSIFVNIIGLLFTAALIGVDVYLPIYLQNVHGYSPLIAGLSLLPMSVTWTLVSIPLGRFVVRFGGKPVNAIGMVITLISFLPLLLFTHDSPIVLIITVISVMGVGFGIALTTQTMVIQESVGFDKRGSAVSVNSLVRTLGQTIGISVFGASFNAAIVRGFATTGITTYDLGNLYDLASYEAGVTWAHISEVLASSIHLVFAILIGILIISLILSLLMPSPPLGSMQKVTGSQEESDSGI